MFNGIEDDAREFDRVCRRGAKRYDDEVLGECEDCDNDYEDEEDENE